MEVKGLLDLEGKPAAKNIRREQRYLRLSTRPDTGTDRVRGRGRQLVRLMRCYHMEAVLADRPRDRPHNRPPPKRQVASARTLPCAPDAIGSRPGQSESLHPNVTPSSSHDNHRRYGMLIAHPPQSLPYANTFQGKRKTAAKPAGPKKVCDCRKPNTPQRHATITCRKRYAADMNHSATASTPSSNASSVIVKTQFLPRSTRRPVLQVFLARTACRATKCPPTVCRSIRSSRDLESRTRLTYAGRPYPTRRRLLRLDRRLRRRSPGAKPTARLVSTSHAQSQPTKVACRSCTG
jgi:hypothetical protein